MKKILSGLMIVSCLGTPNLINRTVIAATPNLQIPAAGSKTVDSKGAKVVLASQPAIVVLDVRTLPEFNNGHLKNARNLDYNAPDFAAKLAKLDKKKPYLVYCAVGGRSSKAAKLMQEQGFLQVFNVSEGYADLKKAGLSVKE